MTGSRAGLGAVPRAPSARQRTVHPEPRKGGSNWAMSPCSKYRSPPEVELSNIWLALQLANNEPNNKESEQAKFTYIMTVKQQLRTHVLKKIKKNWGQPRTPGGWDTQSPPASLEERLPQPSWRS